MGEVLDLPVDGPGGLSVGGRHGDGPPGLNVTSMRAGDPGSNGRRMRADDSPMGDVGVDGIGVARSQGQAGSGLPVVIEAAGGVERVVREGVAPVREDAATADGGELLGVAHGDEPPAVRLREVYEPGEVVGCGHAGFVEQHRRARRPRGRGDAVAGEEPCERVGRAPGGGGEHVGGLAGRREADHR